LGYCLLLGETLVFKFVLEFFFFVVSVSDSYNIFTTSASFGWLLLIPSEDIDRLVFLCTSFAYETVLCGPLKRLSHLFVLFPICCIYFSIVLVCFGSIVRDPIPFSFIGSITSSSFGMEWQ
jgi:hypothetical protein